MKKYSLIGIIVLVFLLTLTGCEQKIKPNKTETLDFDLKIAQSMIKNGEEKIIDLSKCKVINKNQYEIFLPYFIT